MFEVKKNFKRDREEKMRRTSTDNTTNQHKRCVRSKMSEKICKQEYTQMTFSE